MFAGAVARAYADRAPDVPADWLEVARALDDLFAVIDLAAGRPGQPGRRRGPELLCATARAGTLAAGRPDPPSS